MRIKEILTLVLLVLFLISCKRDSFSTISETSTKWSRSSPEAQGLDSIQLQLAFDEAEQRDHIYSLLIIKNDSLVAERYYRGFNKESAFNVRSVSKSFLSALVGIALKDGVLDSLNQTVLEFFSEYTHSGLDQRKKNTTLKNLLQMRAGIDTDNALYQHLYASTNWIRSTIEQPLIDDPGKTFRYNTFLTHLLSGILTKASGMNTKSYANRTLFQFLRISVSDWARDPQGIYFGGNNMYFTARDMARLGQLYLNNGYLFGTQILTIDWIQQSLNNHINPQQNDWGDLQDYGYGYLWWLGKIAQEPVFLALGYGGQFILNFPDLNMIIVSTADAYQPDWESADIKERSTLELVANYIMPAVM